MTAPSLEWTLLPPTSWAQALVAAALLGLSVRGRFRLPRRWRPVARWGALFLLMRIALLGNPWIWQFYGGVLDAEEVGWRQASVIGLQRDLLHPPDSGVRYLAVGSSQTGRIYVEYAREHDDLELFTLAGMTPVDLVLYEEAILHRRPRTILLYLSDFDLARKPPGNALVTAPRQGLRLFGMWATLHTLPMGSEYDGTMAEMLLGEAFPEAKYNFVFRGIADRALERVARRFGRSDPEPEPVSMDQRLEWLRESFDGRYVELNLHFLREFLTHMDARGIETVIVEGRYNPLADTPTTRELSGQARERLVALAEDFATVRYLPSDELVQLDENSFADLTHVTFEVGARMADAVVAKAEGRARPGRYNPAVEPLAWTHPDWLARIDLLESRLRQNPDADVIFVGDSLVQGWEEAGRASWRRLGEEFHPLNLGLAGDRTEHLLWRLERANFSGLDPDVVVLMIGTNNCVRPEQTADEIAEGVEAVVAELRSRLPGARILLHAIWPRGPVGDPARAKADLVNLRIASLAADPAVDGLDLGALFLEPDGRIREDLMPGGLHLSPAGYELWAARLAGPLEELIAAR